MTGLAPQAETHCGRVALLGPPNVGKSTLVNALAQKPLAIVTHKVQTTRHAQDIVICADATQLIVCDTPGVLGARTKGGQAVTRAFATAIRNATAHADILCYMLDASRSLAQNETWLTRLLKNHPPKGRPVWLLLNKQDKCSPAQLLAALDRFKTLYEFAHLIPLSVLRKHNLAQLRALLLAAMPVGPWVYPACAHTDKSAQELAAEITRKQALLQLQDEVPYGLSVNTDAWDERAGALHIVQSLVLARASHKAIALGRGGARIKALSMAARHEIAAQCGQPVHLRLRVSVRKRRADA